MSNLAEQLSEYAHSLQFQQIDNESIIEAKKRILDSLGCAIGSFNEKPVMKTRHLIQNSYVGKASTVLGTKTKTTSDIATFANGLLIRYFDFNDTYLSKEPAHPSDNISACLAAGEANHVTGKDLLAAIVLAYEIQCRLCDAASLRSRGWDHVCYGLVSSALGAGRLFGLNVEELTNAVNISLNSHIAMRQVRAGNLSDWKGFSFANAARNAVFSVMLAKEGITGPSPIFEGEMGFFHQVSGKFDLDLSVFGGIGDGTHFKLPETYIKYYPAEYHSQSAIWAAFEAKKEIGEVKNIISVEIETHEAGYTILGSDEEKWAPKTKETADHSLPFIVGMALLEGKIQNSTYSQRNLVNPNIINFLKKITVKEERNLTSLYPSEIANRIIVKLADGRTVTKQVTVPKGHPRNPMSQDEVVSKFKLLTKRFMNESQIEKIINFVWTIEKQKDISLLPKLCVVKK
ncbi:MAG: MmgE/PrpD family protein [Nitrososphaerales archaeon]|jgi:2-methylcitrate dehydratase